MMTRGVRYVLPPRRVPHQRPVGLGIAAVCLGVIALAAAMTRGMWWPPLVHLLGGGSPTLGLMTIVFPLAFAAIAARGVRFGLLVAFGHSEIAVDARRVVGVHRFGPVRRRRAVNAADIERVIIEPGLGDREGKPDDAFGKGLANLVVDHAHADPAKRKVALTHAYPRETIVALAGVIGETLSVPVVEEAPASLSERLGRSDEPLGGLHRVRRPKRATAELTESPGGISVTLPPRGFVKGSKGLGAFAIVWLVFIGVFSAFWVAAANGTKSSLVLLFPMLICGVFWLVGFGMLFGAIRSGRRRGLIDATAGELVITRQSVGRPKVDGWTADEIDRVVVGPSGTTINDKPVLELQVHLAAGGKRGFFPERRDDELRWLAAEIAHALGKGPRDAPASPASPTTAG